MDESNTLSDAEMRLITINGQTIMLEGDFENINMTNEFLNEMLLINNSKVDINNGCSVQLNPNSCVNSVKEVNDEPTKLAISFQGELNELETVQVGVEDAKEFGLYFYGVKNDWETSGVNVTDNEKVNGQSETENCKVKLHSVPVVSVSCLDREQVDTTDGSFLLSKVDDKVQEDNPESLPAIGHLEGFQIPTSEDGVLLPATVNARMADGSYQTITLVPQIVNGAVTYTVHFSGDRSVNNVLNYKEHYSESQTNGIDVVGSELNNINSGLVNSLQSIKSNQTKMSQSVQKVTNSGIINSNGNVNKSTSNTVNYVVPNQSPIETKIDNLISENENVISKFKKVKYGKKVKSDSQPSSLLNMNKINKSNITKAKKVKFKYKVSDEGKEEKVKVSLLKSNKEDLNKKEEGNKINTNMVPHMNLNSRLEYPNLKAIDETASALSYLKVKSSNTTKQPYFNVLPYPKDKTIPVPKQILPLNCDLQQAKNLISLQKFLETQQLQLKVQPIVSNGNKIVNIRPKPPSKEELKANLKDKNVNNDNTQRTQEDDLTKTLYQECLNSTKFHKSPENGTNTACETDKEVNLNSSGKLNEIFIKNSPEYFSQKFKDGKADEYPLGSSENPIQLVQTGHTFHSRQPLSETQLRQIASILQKQKFDSSNVKKNSIFDPKTNTRIVYRVVYPEDVELTDADRSPAEEGVTKRKRGRHKTKTVTDEEETQKKLSSMPKGAGRRKKSSLSAMDDDVVEEEIEETTPKKKIPRTRSGRLSRPPRYMIKDYKRLHNSDTSEKTLNGFYDSEEEYAAYQNAKETNDNIPELEFDANLLPGRQQRVKRNVKPEYRCPTCQKIYLGHTRMMWHLNKFPDHCNVEKYKENYYRKRAETKVRRAARKLSLCDVSNKVKQILKSMSKDELTSLCGPMLAEALTIWDFLLLRVNLLKDTKKDEVDALLHELIVLLEKLTKIAEDIFLPVFTKEAEREEDCVVIDRMEVAIALGLPVGFYKVNNDNLSLLRFPLKPPPPEPANKEVVKEAEKVENDKPENENLFSEKPMEPEETKQNLFDEKSGLWDNEKESKKLEEPFWLESKVEDSNEWNPPEVKPLSTKFEPNLSTKILESSNDSIDDSKFEEPVQLIDLDSNSKDVDQSNSSGNLDGSPIAKDHPKMVVDKSLEPRQEEKLWNENSTDKVSGEVWNENSRREKWEETAGKSSSELWPNENSELPTTNEKQTPHLWNENSNLTSSEKVDETNSEFLDSLLSVPNSSEFLGNESGGFLSENIGLMNEKKVNEVEPTSEGKQEWRNDNESRNYWETNKNASWSKQETILSERLPGVRTTTRLTSTPETNASMSFSIPNRRNSISDFSNINLESGNLDMVLPPAKTLIKDCLKDDGMKGAENSFLGNSEVKNWEADNGNSTNVNSEELTFAEKMLESLTAQHDVISVPPSTFDSAMGILNQSQETPNLNLFTSSETDGLDFNLPLPDHLLRTNFAPTNFQTASSETPAFLSTTNNIFDASCSKYHQYDSNFADKKSKSLDDVMEFLGAKNSFNGFENCNTSETTNINNFSFDSESRSEFPVPQTAIEPQPPKKPKIRVKKPLQKTQRSPKGAKKVKTIREKKVDYPKTNTIESIINEALFDSCASAPKSLQIENSSPSGNSSIPNPADNYSLPIIPGSLDEVENLDFLNQD